MTGPEGELSGGTHWAERELPGRVGMFRDGRGGVGASGFCVCVAHLEIVQMASFPVSVIAQESPDRLRSALSLSQGCSPG